MNCEACGGKIGAAFYCALNDAGNTILYCYDCFYKIVVDNQESEVVGKCECGSGNLVGDGHSVWCPIYKKELA